MSFFMKFLKLYCVIKRGTHEMRKFNNVNDLVNTLNLRIGLLY